MTAVLLGFGMKIDWSTLTVIEPARQGLLVTNRLLEDAAICRELLDHEKLIDPENGVEYLLNFLCGYFLKGTQNVFLCRFLAFFYHRRGNNGLVTFISKLKLRAS